MLIGVSLSGIMAGLYYNSQRLVCVQTKAAREQCDADEECSAYMELPRAQHVRRDDQHINTDEEVFLRCHRGPCPRRIARRGGRSLLTQDVPGSSSPHGSRLNDREEVRRLRFGRINASRRRQL